MIKRIFGPNRVEVKMMEKILDEKPQNLYCSLNVIRDL
jgi:hypothetical protein